MGVGFARGRAVLLVVGLASGWVPVLWLCVPALTLGGHSFDEALTTGLAGLLLLCWAWWSLAAATLALEVAATGSTRAAHRAPRTARALVAAVCGAGALAAIAAPAMAEPIGSSSPEVHLLTGLALPDRPTGTHRPALHQAASHTDVVVHSGDTLWAISRDLGLDWQSLYAANRELVGPDPDLIHPGQRLVVPSHTHNEGASR